MENLCRIGNILELKQKSRLEKDGLNNIYLFRIKADQNIKTG